jgi:hypothetical protein
MLFVVVSAAAAVGMFGAGAQAAPEHQSPAGSTFDGQNVDCGHSRTFLDAPVVVRNDWSGAEVCADGGLGPVQGRAFVRSNYDKPGAGPIYLPDYIHVDGDEDNPVAPGHVAYFNLPG